MPKEPHRDGLRVIILFQNLLIQTKMWSLSLSSVCALSMGNKRSSTICIKGVNRNGCRGHYRWANKKRHVLWLYIYTLHSSVCKKLLVIKVFTAVFMLRLNHQLWIYDGNLTATVCGLLLSLGVGTESDNQQIIIDYDRNVESKKHKLFSISQDLKIGRNFNE